MDIYTKEIIKKMNENGILQYFKLMLDNKEIPEENKITLLYLKVKDYEKMVNEEILNDAMKRRKMYNDEV